MARLISFVFRVFRVFVTCGRKAIVASSPAKYPIASRMSKEEFNMPGLLIGDARCLNAEIVVIHFESRLSCNQNVARGFHPITQPNAVYSLVAPFDLCTQGPE